ncbi:MAG TPA: TetR/AcrR family transcriptional regulator [Chitinophagales bacterium]
MKTISKSEQTRRFIVETVAPIFNTKGFSGTSLSDLTEATKLTKGSISGNFENKEEVALGAFHHNTKLRANAISARVKEAKSYTEKLLVYAEIFNSNNNKVFPKGGCPLLNLGIEADDTHEDFRQAVSAELLSWKKSIVSIIKKGIEAKELKKDTEIERTALSIIALVEGGIFIAKSTKNGAYLDTVLETVKMLIHNIAATKKTRH